MEEKINDERDLRLLKYINTFFIVLSGIALLVEFAVFSFEHWFVDFCLFVNLSFVTLNLCLTVLNPESKRFWVQFRVYCAYAPFTIIVIITIIELIFFGSIVEDRLAKEYTDEQREEMNIKLIATLSLLVPSIPVILQGLTFSVYFKWLSDFDKAQRRYEIAERLRVQDQENLISE